MRAEQEELFAQWRAEAAARLEAAAEILSAELETEQVEAAWLGHVRHAGRELMGLARHAREGTPLPAVDWLAAWRLALGVPRKALRMAARGGAMRSAAAIEDLDQILDDLDDVSRAIRVLRERLVSAAWVPSACGAA